MVNSIIVSRYSNDLPLAGSVSRKIHGGPLYTASEVLGLLREGGENAVLAWTRKCQQDMQKFSLDNDDVCELIKAALHSGRYKDSEWCVQHPNGPWAACDAYSLQRREWMERIDGYLDMEYYIKFAIAKTGQMLLVASCHT